MTRARSDAAARTREPTLALERKLLREASAVIGIDEVGRGALAGPVSVGAAIIGRPHLRRGVPAGLRDSKLLTPARRDALEPACRAWPAGVAVGASSCAEIEEHGILRALAAAAARALEELAELVDADAVILLDGTHDWLSASLPRPARVITRAKADRDCASVACASVVAKVTRDREMVARHEEAAMYGWASNKGYASVAHIAAIREHGPHALHRTSWLARILEEPGADELPLELEGAGAADDLAS